MLGPSTAATMAVTCRVCGTDTRAFLTCCKLFKLTYTCWASIKINSSTTHNIRDDLIYFFRDWRHFPIVTKESVRLDAQEYQVGVDDGAGRDHLRHATWMDERNQVSQSKVRRTRWIMKYILPRRYCRRTGRRRRRPAKKVASKSRISVTTTSSLGGKEKKRKSK